MSNFKGKEIKIEYDADETYCSVCNMSHPNPCNVVCGKCQAVGHRARDCTGKVSKSMTPYRFAYVEGFPRCSVCSEHQVEFCPISCPGHQTLRLQNEFWELEVKNDDIETYTNRFLELSRLCPNLVTPEYMKIARYTWGLPPKVQLYVASAQIDSMEEMIQTAYNVMNLRRHLDEDESANVNAGATNQKESLNFWADEFKGHSGRGYLKEVVQKVKEEEPPICDKCNWYHTGKCAVRCWVCSSEDHKARKCPKIALQSSSSSSQRTSHGTCYKCGSSGHLKRNCPN